MNGDARPPPAGATEPPVRGNRRTRPVIIAVGGPTCSGKTTLAKHLQTILPRSVILHQDDFAPPSELVPFHPVHGVQDWDDPEGAIEWPRLRSSLSHLRSHGSLPASHSSHDHLNVQSSLPITPSIASKWRARFEKLALPPAPEDGKAGGEDRMDYVIADGFLLYWDEACVRSYDVKLFVRESEPVLRHRREIRQTYHTADGLTWRDPPNYWSQIVWPAYLKGHRHLFANGDVEKEVVDQGSWIGKGLVVLQPGNGGGNGNGNGKEAMGAMVERALEEVWKIVAGGAEAGSLN